MDDTTQFDEDALLGEAPPADMASETPEAAAPVTEQPVETPFTPAPEQAGQVPTLANDQTEIGRAFAAQREALEQKYQAQMALAQQQAREQAIRDLYAAQQQEQQYQPEEIPDPIIDPEGFAAWQGRREDSIRQEMQTQIQTMQAQSSIAMAQQWAELSRTQTGYGWSELVKAAWDEINRVAPLMGADPSKLADYVQKAPDAGQRITQWGLQGLQRGGGAAPVDVEAIKAQARADALKELQAKASASPHNLAVPGVGSVPSQAVAETRVLSEDEILAQ